jgi:hypothetical protein
VTSPIESSGVITARDGKLDLAGPVTGGQFVISQAATLELGGPAAEAVTFEPGAARPRSISQRLSSPITIINDQGNPAIYNEDA